LKVRTDHLEEMATWKEDLGSRLWRAQATVRVTGMALYDMTMLEAEVKLYGEVARRMKELRDHPKEEQTQVDDQPASL